jgi:hypothetical protein
MEITEIIRELETQVEKHSGLNRRLLSTAISNLKMVSSKKLNGFQSLPDPRDLIDYPCPDCQPNRPCYGHGHGH